MDSTPRARMREPGSVALWSPGEGNHRHAFRPVSLERGRALVDRRAGGHDVVDEEDPGGGPRARREYAVEVCPPRCARESCLIGRLARLPEEAHDAPAERVRETTGEFLGRVESALRVRTAGRRHP